MDRLADKLSQKELAALTDLKTALLQQFDITDMRLFGSKARGTGHPESDLDLFIVVPELDWEREKAIYTLCFEVSLRYDLLIAPILCSQAEIDNPLVKEAPFYQTIQAEGLPV
jgi:predicted nucleotidyltransferase